MSQTSSIDDVLVTAHLPPQERPAPNLEVVKNDVVPEIQGEDLGDMDVQTPSKPEVKPEVKQESVKVDDKTSNDDGLDEYGNEKPKREARTYSEEEVNERINRAVRERFERMQKNNPNAQQQFQQPNQQQVPEQQPGDWKEELKQMIRQTTQEEQRAQAIQAQQMKEQQLHAEFEAKFHQGMSNFSDFRDVVGSQPFSDAMVIATRAMKDPAAFMYAASKRHAAEIQRISQIQDPTTQMVEIGRLEERMKKSQSATKAPRPVGKTREDATIEEPTRREQSFEELLMQSDAQRLARMRKGRR